ncbi:MAG: tetratricopeptide repeat protein, partial [Gallionellaceae bacterium]|nr:tetratricopeptide repeat protein [Gallionellaceae bacterium]
MSEAQVISEQISAAVASYDRGDMAQAMAVLKPLIEQHPDVAWALNVAGNCARAMGDLDSAENYLRRALAQHPRYVQAYNNLGIVLRELRRFSEAEAAFRQAIEINGGDYGNGRLNLAMLLLYMGRLAEGWPYFESRYHDLSRGCPQWHGEPLAGKSILVCHEQGFGDQIQFIRYLPHLKAMGASRVTIMCDAVLWPLLESADGANEVLDADVVDVKEKASAHDFWVQLLSLPLLLGTTLASIPATVPYLKVPQRRLARWESQLPTGGLRVGLVWKGRAAHVNDRYRSLPGLQALAPLWAV